MTAQTKILFSVSLSYGSHRAKIDLSVGSIFVLHVMSAGTAWRLEKRRDDRQPGSRSMPRKRNLTWGWVTSALYWVLRVATVLADFHGRS